MTWHLSSRSARSWGDGPLPPPPDGWCNSGGPRSRTRTEKVYATVLGTKAGCIRVPLVRRLGLAFGERNPVDWTWALLEQEGLRDPEDLRRHYALPAGPLICRAGPAVEPLDVARAPARDVLEVALWLGLCTAWMFDPARPVLWTRASLTRRLDVFAGEGFYA